MYDITPVVNAFIAIISALIAAVLIPWIKRRFDYKDLQTWVKVCVLAAEQIYGAGNGRAKLEYVADLLRDKGIEVDIDDITDEIRAMIEAAVRELGDAEKKEPVDLAEPDEPEISE
jgi:uncharacterized protein YajQ (UPF0234 family)